GLNFLHAIGIIHMDLKPENIFVNEEGNCAIGDFGGSFYEPSVPSQLDRPTPRTSCCTAGFVAPEVVDHFNPTVNHLADFWSLGVSVYALVV
ncbi:kinase-like domain-containing protein, partial [Gymnopilus junonius]